MFVTASDIRHACHREFRRNTGTHGCKRRILSAVCIHDIDFGRHHTSAARVVSVIPNAILSGLRTGLDGKKGCVFVKNNNGCSCSSTVAPVPQWLLLFINGCSCSSTVAPVPQWLLLFLNGCSCSSTVAPVPQRLLLFLNGCSCSSTVAPVPQRLLRQILCSLAVELHGEDDTETMLG